jgi:hypothetical protein
MNDPDIINEPMPMREVHAVRLMIYDEIKDMSVEEISEYFRKGAERVCKEFNIKTKPFVA